MAVARRPSVRLVWVVILASCARVPPVQRAKLAAPVMQAPVWPVLETEDEHLHEVREGTGGATGTAGGGCGCN